MILTERAQSKTNVGDLKSHAKNKIKSYKIKIKE